MVEGPSREVDRRGLHSILKRRGFFWPSFEIYGGVAGFFDLGPLGSLLKDNIERIWKQRFVVEEEFLLVDCPSINPEAVFKASGHLEKFSDHLTRCQDCGVPFRADHLLESLVKNPDTLDKEELEEALTQYGVACPDCGGKLGPLEEFNLMFSTHIGPGNEKRAYLRPETAQSIFLDFNSLYRFNRERMPFGVAQIGRGYRNEISPRQGMIRLREFHMAEGEFFYDPEEDTFPRFERYRDKEVPLVPNTDPERTISRELGSAVSEGIISSRVMAHFMGATFSFAEDIGIPKEAIRFRQHEASEMAHYAMDCWDLEVSTSWGWVETVGIADRSAYDLSQHSKGSGSQLTADRKFEIPVERVINRLEGDMKVLGPVLRSDAGAVMEVLSRMDPEFISSALETSETIPITVGDRTVEVPSNGIRIVKGTEKVHRESYIPSVIEPSFGIDRLMVGLLENNYREQAASPLSDDESEEPYRVISLPPGTAPIKAGVFPLVNKDGLPKIASEIDLKLKREGLVTYMDTSGSIGRRYARMDEVGTPFCITVDHDTKKDRTVTIRERDTGAQVRVGIDDLPELLNGLIHERVAFSSLG